MPTAIDYTGRVIGKLKVLKLAPKREGSTLRRWYVRCECGTKKSVAANELARIHSCGCDRIEKSVRASTKHGLRKHPLYQRYHAMLGRCHTRSHKEYPNYGARGIKVCRAWRHKEHGLARYIQHVMSLPNPSKGTEVDRIDNNVGYEPGNLRWATRTRNARNMRRTLYVVWKNKRAALRDVLEAEGLPKSSYSTISMRIKSGWSLQKALSTPIRIYKGGS